MKITLNLKSVEDYRLFLKIKGLPRYHFQGREAEFPDEYASLIGVKTKRRKGRAYVSSSFLFDYQRDISRIAITKRKYAIFADPGLGKTLMLLEFARHVRSVLPGKRVLIISPLMVIRQTMSECQRFYGDTLPIEQVRARDLQAWMDAKGGALGITNYDAIHEDLTQGNLGCLILDESSMLKSQYGKWATSIIDLGKGLEWKLCLTGTPAPNDRIEYANHAVFLDHFPTQNAFLAKYFVNRGQTDNRWELKSHALRPFYTSLSHWCIFVTNPATYGWKDNVGTIPPIHVHIHDVDLTDEQREMVHLVGGDMFGTPGGITSRSKIAQLAKGRVTRDGGKVDVETNKPGFIRDLVSSWEKDEQTIIWCEYNAEQETMERVFPDAASLSGDTPEEKREQLIADFKEGRRRVLISKSKILGFGLNLQMATRQVFSGLKDSYESYYQSVKRSNRVGSTRPLNVHIPVTDIERPMIETVLRKAKRVQQDTEEQEKLFKETGYVVAG